VTVLFSIRFLSSSVVCLSKVAAMSPYDGDGVGGRLKIFHDRGSELNERRLRGEGIDVVFSVHGELFPAHRFVVSLYSPYLRAIVDPGMAFRESGSREIELRNIDTGHFGDLLSYLYTGSITLHDDNVFELLELAQYLQLEQDNLAEKCAEFLERGLATCSLKVVFKVWNVAEQCGSQRLRNRVLSVLEFRLEEFLPKDIFLYLGYEEIKQVLSHPPLCIKSEKTLFNSLVEWVSRKSPAATTNNDDSSDDESGFEMAAELISLVKLDVLPADYVRDVLPSACSRLLSFKPTSPRLCQNCVYLFEYSRDESEMLGIREFASERKNQTTFAYFEPGSAAAADCPVATVRSPTQSKSYFQHYGPHSTTAFQVVASADGFRQALVMGGLRKSSRESVLSSDIKLFDLTTATWEHQGGSLPRGMADFGAAVHENKLYVIGGLTDEACFGGGRAGGGSGGGGRKTFLNKQLNISRGVHRIGCGDFTGMSGWESLESMPRERTDFSTALIDDRIYVVGSGFCDVYDIKSAQWHVREVPHALGDLGVKRPAVAVVGTSLYVFGDRPAEGSNVFLRLDTLSSSPSDWRTLEPLTIRQDVVAAFAHNNLIYLIGWQRETKNVIHCYDPFKAEWKCVVERVSGTMRPGMLARKQHLEAAFFDGAQSINRT
jgi:N-acetylneuraminic acid mutarotase